MTELNARFKWSRWYYAYGYDDYDCGYDYININIYIKKESALSHNSLL